MRFVRRRRAPVEVNLTPLIDVVFLLLIFFMVSTTFETRQALELELPQSDSAAPLTASPVTLVVTRDGEYRLGEQRLDAAGLTMALADVTDAAREHGLIVEADRQSAHGAVVTALDRAGALGIQQVRIATRDGQDSSTHGETP
ncbi:biopolymer transport protein ExbD [Franzmannia pantelleriensis]|uniref:Biopolymer transport protein ExbD n=1 Tax=Franzmannia pantelleriensis TaxID=48727 RepID=A0A1G9NRK8_9GAMM|nr:biopolymer transporter ExbD [Halomonas pantelleriensis]SDL88667.1 biopolymer transport protein ExbD [Halomonas pantelleriensis]